MYKTKRIPSTRWHNFFVRSQFQMQTRSHWSETQWGTPSTSSNVFQTLHELEVRVSVHETLDKYRVCYLSLSGSNPRTRPWGLVTSVHSRIWRTFWSRHSCQMTHCVGEKPPAHDCSYPPVHDCTYRSLWHITSHCYRQKQVHRKFTKWCAQESRCLPPDTLFECVHTRERVHLSLESCTPSCDAWPFPSLNVSTQTPFLHTLQYYSVTIDLFVFNELGDHLRESRSLEQNVGAQIPTMIPLLITHSPITLSNLSSLNLVYIFWCSSPPYNPVYLRRVDLSDLTFSLSSHRNVYNIF